MPTYNRAGLIGKAIESVVNQKYENWELLIIDDGSTDNTEEVIAQFSDDRIRYIYQNNQERSAARNNGIIKAKGSFVCFLDSDDYYLDNFLAEFEHAIKENNNKEAFYFCNTYRETSEGIIEKSVGANVTFQVNYDFLLINTIGTPRVCLPVEVAKNNLFDLTVENGEDFELWMRLINDLEIKYIDVYTQVFLDHNARSINNDAIKKSICAVELRIEIANKIRFKFSKKAYQFFMNQSNLKLARTYFEIKKSACIKYSLRVLFSSSSFKKEALFMLIKSM